MQQLKKQVSSSSASPSRGMDHSTVLDRLLVHHIEAGARILKIQGNKPVFTAGKNGAGEKLEHVTPVALVKSFVRLLVAAEQVKPTEEVTEADIVELVGGVFHRDVLLPFDNRFLVRRSEVRILRDGAKDYSLEFAVEPAFVVGYGKPVDPSAAPSEGDLLVWMDDFLSRLFAMLPRVKDVIFSPNKPCPMVSLTGGMKEVEDVALGGGGALTERLAHALVSQASSPHIDDLIQANGGHLRRLDLDLSYRTRSGRRCRVNIADSFDINNDNGPLITMRLLPERPWTTKELPLPRAVLNGCLETSMGLVLIAGPTGSGKSTTMGVVVDFLLRRKSVNFLTIENPIETVFPPGDYPRSLISQREIGKHASSLQRGLESAVRQTLDMAMVGEIRNAQDATLALELAKSGHLIFATVHAGSVEMSVDRIVDMYPPDQERKIRGMLSTHVKMMLAQRLIRGRDGSPLLVLEYARITPDMQERMVGKQRAGAELSLRELMEAPGARACQSMDQALIRLLEDGKITEDGLMYHSPDPGALVLRQSKLGVKLSRRWDPTGALIDQDMGDRLTMHAKILAERDLRD